MFDKLPLAIKANFLYVLSEYHDFYMLGTSSRNFCIYQSRPELINSQLMVFDKMFDNSFGSHLGLKLLPGIVEDILE